MQVNVHQFTLIECRLAFPLICDCHYTDKDPRNSRPNSRVPATIWIIPACLLSNIENISSFDSFMLPCPFRMKLHETHRRFFYRLFHVSVLTDVPTTNTDYRSISQPAYYGSVGMKPSSLTMSNKSTGI